MFNTPLSRRLSKILSYGVVLKIRSVHYYRKTLFGCGPKLTAVHDPTLDGTGMRDFIHVEDLACGHVAALNYIQNDNRDIIANLGAGRSYSVIQLIKSFETVSGKKIPFEIVSRRSGDLPEYYADISLAKEKLNWSAKLGIDKMCEDVWRWQLNNPEGYS